MGDDSHPNVQQLVVRLVLTDDQRRVRALRSVGVMHYDAGRQRLAEREFGSNPMGVIRPVVISEHLVGTGLALPYARAMPTNKPQRQPTRPATSRLGLPSEIHSPTAAALAEVRSHGSVRDDQDVQYLRVGPDDVDI